MFSVSSGLVEKPTAVPAAMGRRIDAAAFEKREVGRVRERMWVVILWSILRLVFGFEGERWEVEVCGCLARDVF